MNILDPRGLPEDFYFISKSGVDLVSGLIQWKTGLWNHSMVMRSPGKVVWQGLQIKEKPMDLYMTKNVRMDFFTLKGDTRNVITAMNNYIDKKMKGPWYGQTYDFLGIFGQAIGLPWIHTPGLAYCSVFELSVLRAGAPFLSTAAADIIMKVPVESNPQNIHDLYSKNPDIFEYVGMYESDIGIIV